MESPCIAPGKLEQARVLWLKPSNGCIQGTCEPPRPWAPGGWPIGGRGGGLWPMGGRGIGGGGREAGGGQ